MLPALPVCLVPFPNLTFSTETLGLDKYVFGKERRTYFTLTTDHIMENHTGTSVRTLKLSWAPDYSPKDRYYLEKWLQMAAKPGIEELSLVLDSKNGKYKFPCLVLSNGMGDSIRYLALAHCAFRPTAELCCLRSLTRVNLCAVHITGDELWCLLSNSFALESLSLRACSEIICLKIPCALQRLTYMSVLECRKLQVIESKAPNLSMFDIDGKRPIEVSLGESLLVKSLFIKCSGSSCYYTRAVLVSSIPTNLESLGTHSSREMIDAPTVSSKCLYLHSLFIGLAGVPFVLSVNCPYVVYFIGASLSLETFISHVKALMDSAFVSGDAWALLDSVEKTSESLSPEKKKNMVELACHILRAWL